MNDKNPGGRPALATPEQIFDAANEIANRGDSPSFMSVSAIVNGGTRSYINKHLMAWDTARQKSGQSQIPGEIMDLYQKAYAKGRHLGYTEHANSVISLRNEVINSGEEFENLQEVQTNLVQERDQLLAVISELTSKLNSIQLDHARLKLALDQACEAREKAMLEGARTEQVRQSEIGFSLRIESDLTKSRQEAKDLMEFLRSEERAHANLQGQHKLLLDHRDELIKEVQELAEKIITTYSCSEK